jgi:hypothetical protein
MWCDSIFLQGTQESDLADAVKELNLKLHSSMQELEAEKSSKRELEEQLSALRVTKDNSATCKEQEGIALGDSIGGDTEVSEMKAQNAKLEKTIETWKVTFFYLCVSCLTAFLFLLVHTHIQHSSFCWH